MTRKKREKKPKHRTEVRAYLFAMDINQVESNLLHRVRESTHRLRNLLVMERHENRIAVRSDTSIPYITKSDQYKRISVLFHSDADLKCIHSQVLQNVADRIDEGTKRWFDALKDGRHHVAPPKPIDLKKHKSFTYTQYGTAAYIEHGCLVLSKIGKFKLHDHRKIRGKKKSVTVKFKDGRWWAVITAEVQAADLYQPEWVWKDKPDTGIDPGLKNGLNDSGGVAYATPKPLKAALKGLKQAQQKMSRQFDARKSGHAALMAQVKEAGLQPVPLKESPYSNRLNAQIRCVAKKHTKVARTRDYAAKKNAAIVSDRFRRVAVEEHPVKFMFANRRTARAAADVGIGKQKQALQCKLGKRYAPTANRRQGIGGNSQTCLCGESVPKTLKDRWHQCPACGLAGDRDWISANIVQHTAFGTVHESVARACGQQILDRALALLGMRGEGKVLRGETRPGREAVPVEPSVKRKPRVSRKSGSTAGGEPTAGGKTVRHCKGKSFPDALSDCAATLDIDSKGLSGSPRL